VGRSIAESSAKQRAPAMRQFASLDEVRQWVMNEADAVRPAVEWITEGTARERVRHRVGARPCRPHRKPSRIGSASASGATRHSPIAYFTICISAVAIGNFLTF
jgi:hypothetical protein